MYSILRDGKFVYGRSASAASEPTSAPPIHSNTRPMRVQVPTKPNHMNPPPPVNSMIANRPFTIGDI